MAKSKSGGHSGGSNYLSSTLSLQAIYGIVVAALSVLAIIAACIRINRYRKLWPYSFVILAACAFVIYGAIEASNGDLSYSPSDDKNCAAIFFTCAFAPIMWILLFDTFRVIAPQDQPGKKFFRATSRTLAGTYFGYLWGAVLIIIAVAYVCLSKNSSYSGLMTLEMYNAWMQEKQNIIEASINLNKVYTYGLWAFFAPLFVQLYFSSRDVRPVIKTFGAYIFLIFVVNLGPSVSMLAGTLTLKTTLYFVLYQLFGIFALCLVIYVGHTWKHIPSGGGDTEEHRIGSHINLSHQNTKLEPDHRLLS